MPALGLYNVASIIQSCSVYIIMKKKNLALFDLDDTLFDGDTEGEWVKYMDKAGLIQDSEFFNKMQSFEKSYRQGDLNVDEYS